MEMRILQEMDIKQYQEQGYLIVENLISDQEIKQLRQRTEDIIAGHIPEYPSSTIELEPGATRIEMKTVRKLNACAENDAVFLSHAKHEKVLDIVESILGPDIKMYASQGFLKPPGGVEKPYHQDSAYFDIEPMNLVTCWTALDDVTLEKGPMWVIPGSHQNGIVDHSLQWKVRDRQDKQVPDNLIDHANEKSIIMPAGSCSFHHSLLLHRSTANLSNQSRRGLAIHYMSANSRWTNSKTPQPSYILMRGQESPGCV